MKSNIGISDYTNCDPLAKFVDQQMKRGYFSRGNTRIGNFSIDSHLQMAQRAYDLQFEDCDIELVEESGVDTYMPVVRAKADVLADYMNDMLQTRGHEIFTFSSSPVPDLAPVDRYTVIQRIRQELGTNQQFEQTDIVELVRVHKQRMIEELRQISASHDQVNSLQLADMVFESNLKKQLRQVVTHFSYHPYTAMVGPVATTVAGAKRNSNGTLGFGRKQQAQFKAVHPANIFASPDYEGEDTGEFVLRTTAVTLADLNKLLATSDSKWNKAAIREIYKDVSHSRSKYVDWLFPKKTIRQTKDFAPASTTNFVYYYGLVPGKLLHNFYNGLERDYYYECEVVTCKDKTLYVAVRNAAQDEFVGRNLHVAAYRKHSSTFAGYSLTHSLRDVQRAANMAFRYLIVNSGYASEPFGEVDVKRIRKYVDKDSWTKAMMGMMVPTDPDQVNGTAQPAYRFHHIDNQTAQFSSLFQFFMQLADSVSGLPAMLNGTPEGSGAMRTFRGMVHLQANAMKSVQQAFDEFDNGILTPVGEHFYAAGLDNNKFSGDSQARVHGLGGLLRDEIQSQQVSENLSTVSQLAAAAPQAVPPESLNWAIKRALQEAGVPEYTMDTPVQQPDASQVTAQ